MNEATTIFRYVVPQLQELGWALEDIEFEKYGQYDICLLDKFIIEAKRFRILSNPENRPYQLGVPQLQKYLKESGLPYGCLTDGESWYWVEAEKIHKIKDLKKLSKSKLKDLQVSKCIEMKIEDYCGETLKRSIKLTVLNGHILSKDKIKAVL